MSNLLKAMLHGLMAKADDDTTTGGGAGGKGGAETDAFDEEERRAQRDTQAAERRAADPGADGRPADITEAEWKSLSPAERAAIAEPAEDEDSLRAIAGEDDNDGDDDGTEGKGGGKDGGDDKGGEDEAQKKAREEAEQRQAAEEKAAADTEAAANKGPTVADQIKEIDGKITALDAQKDALQQKFDDGDIESAEFRAESKKLDADVRQLERDRTRVEVREDARNEAEENRWGNDCATFFAASGNEIYKGKLAAGALDTAVKDAVSEKSLEKHPERARWTGPQILAFADAEVRKELGLAKAAPKGGKETAADKKAAEEATAAEKKAAALRTRKPDLKSVPKTLAHLPAADNTESGAEGDEFAAVDKLEGMELERAIAAMKPAQLERYMKSA